MLDGLKEVLNNATACMKLARMSRECRKFEHESKSNNRYQEPQGDNLIARKEREKERRNKQIEIVNLLN